MEIGLTFEKVWTMFQETDKKFQETDKKFQETEKQMREVFQEIARESRKTEKKLKELEKLFVGNWGKLMEALVEGELVNLLNQRGIAVNQTAQRVTRFHNNKQYEIDIIAENGNEIIFVEVKTTLKPEHVQNFLEKLKVAKEVFPLYKNFKIYGAIAYLRYESEAITYAMNSGLFVIRTTSKSAKIMNPTDFKPREF